MAVGVVDGLEVIQVQKSQCELASVAGVLDAGALQPVLQQHPVRQPRQRIVLCKVAQRSQPLLFRDVLHHRQPAHGTARAVVFPDGRHHHIQQATVSADHLQFGDGDTAVVESARVDQVRRQTR